MSLRRLQDMPDIREMEPREALKFLKQRENRLMTRPSDKVQGYCYRTGGLLPAAYWAATYWIIGPVGLNHASPADFGETCIKMADSWASLKRWARHSLQANIELPVLAEFYSEALCDAVHHRALAIAKHGAEYDWKARCRGRFP